MADLPVDLLFAALADEVPNGAPGWDCDLPLWLSGAIEHFRVEDGRAGAFCWALDEQRSCCDGIQAKLFPGKFRKCLHFGFPWTLIG